MANSPDQIVGNQPTAQQLAGEAALKRAAIGLKQQEMGPSPQGARSAELNIAAAPPLASPGEISSGLSAVEFSISLLEQAVIALCEGIHSVQRPPGPTAESDASPVDPVRSQHASVLFEFNQRLVAIVAMVEENSARLDI